jgi:hypothetical protein
LAKVYRIDRTDGSQQTIFRGTDEGDAFTAGVGTDDNQMVLSAFETPPPDRGDEFSRPSEASLLRLRFRSLSPVTEVSTLNAPPTVTAGDTLTVSTRITNAGDARLDDGEVEFRLDQNQDGGLSGNEVLATRQVDLRPGASTTVTFRVDTAGLAAGSYVHGVFTANDTVTGTIEIESDRASETDLTIDPATDALEPGETATFDVVAETPSEGVGSYGFEIATSDASVLAVEDVSLDGNPGLDDVTVANDGSAATVSASSLRDTGVPTLATVTVTATGAGSASLSLSDVQVGYGDGGDDYRIGTVGSSDVTVEPADDGTGGVTVGLAPANPTVSVGGTRTVNVVVTGASDGVNGFDLSVESSDADTVRLVDVAFAGNAGPQFRTAEFAPDNSSVAVSAVFSDVDGASEATILNLTVEGAEEGSADLSIDVADADGIVDGDGDAYRIDEETGGTVTVRAGGPAVGGNPPATDPDGDGRYEDVNGDGSLGVGDVIVLFRNVDASAAQTDEFDFNADGDIGIGDVVRLFNEL